MSTGTLTWTVGLVLTGVTKPAWSLSGAQVPRWLVIHTKGDISVGVLLNRRHAQLVTMG